jgi:hypothetical protein
VDTIVITTAVRHQAPVVTGGLTRNADSIGVKNPDLRNLTSTQSRLTGHGTWTTASRPGHPATPATDSAEADCAS